MNAKIRSKLLQKTIRTYFMALLFTGLIIFLPACTLKFWNGWLYIGTLFIPMIFVLVYLWVKNQDLLEKRLKTREKEETQKTYLVLSIVVLFATYIIPGLDFQFHWSAVPLWLVLVSTGIVLCGYILFFAAMNQNTYASRVVEVQENQKLIETGLYAVVRHPMYLAGLILYGFSPLVLGSYVALIPMVFLPVLLVIRIRNEEKVLSDGLTGYKEYMKKVKYRLIPYIW